MSCLEVKKGIVEIENSSVKLLAPEGWHWKLVEIEKKKGNSEPGIVEGGIEGVALRTVFPVEVRGNEMKTKNTSKLLKLDVWKTLKLVRGMN